jgi:HTH-type transcriptional regulator / antitoxin HigA
MLKMTPLEVLKYLMEQNDLSTTDLGYAVGSRGLASEILNGKRGLSKLIIQKLSVKFSVDPGLFLGEQS